jgi:chromosome segregation ATPase
MLEKLQNNILNRIKKMSLLDDDLTEKLDIPMIFAAIESLRETMNKNLEEIATHEKAISALHKNVSNARFELENVKNLLDEIVNPKPKCDDTDSKFKNIDLNSELQKLLEGFTTSTDLWYNPSNYATTAAITANGARYYTTTCDAYDYDAKTITGI